MTTHNRTCENPACGQSFYARPAEVARGGGKCCSKACGAKMRGKAALAGATTMVVLAGPTATVVPIGAHVMDADEAMAKVRQQRTAHLRRVMVSAWDKDQRKPVEIGEARFHQFTVESEELEVGALHVTCGVVEFPDGRIDTPCARHIRFLE
jgi:hypothetical protein